MRPPPPMWWPLPTASWRTWRYWRGKPSSRRGRRFWRGRWSSARVKEPKYATVDAGQRLVHARGSVWASTYRTLEACIPLEADTKVYTGEEETAWSLSILGHTVNFFGKGSISTAGYDKMTTTHILTLPGGREMPLALVKTEYRAYETQSAAIQTAAAQALLEERLLERLCGVGPSGMENPGFDMEKFAAMQEG